MTTRQGAQGTYDGASHGALDGEFGTHKDDEVVQKILESGSDQEVEVGFPSGATAPFLTPLPVFLPST
jgi:hypothetical protein